MKYSFNGRGFDIPDDYLSNSMKKLNITKMEAVQLWLEDNGILLNEEQRELDRRAGALKIDHGNFELTRQTQNKNRPRKVNLQKQEMMKKLYSLFEGYSNLEMVNDERELTFSIGSKEYSVTLTEHRKK